MPSSGPQKAATGSSAPIPGRPRVAWGLISEGFSKANTKAHSLFQIPVGVQKNLSRALNLFPLPSQSCRGLSGENIPN